MIKYNANLMIIGNKVFSYCTHVATILDDNKTMIQHRPQEDFGKNGSVSTGKWSVTTQRHIQLIAKEEHLKIIRE